MKIVNVVEIVMLGALGYAVKRLNDKVNTLHEHVELNEDAIVGLDEVTGKIK